MGLWIQISPGSSEPIYAQVVSQISQAIAKGELAVGAKLPSVRNLAGELVINPNTVARAYSALERQGLVSTKTGAGTFVSDPALRSVDAAQLSLLAERMETVITQGLNLGLDAGELCDLFARRAKQFTRGQGKGKKST